MAALEEGRDSGIGRPCGADYRPGAVSPGDIWRNLLLVRDWPAEDEGLLWMPADEDLRSVPEIMQVDRSRDLDGWVEVLGEPPRDLNLRGILYLAYCAAVEQLRAL